MTTTIVFTLSPAFPGKAETVTVTERSKRLALNVGLVRAVQQAGWLAFVYGSCTVVNDLDRHPVVLSARTPGGV